MLDINNLSVSLLKDDRPLIQNLSFSLGPQDKMAILSEEGLGKSSLLKCIMNIPQDHLKIKGHINTHQSLIGYLPQTLENQERSVLDYFYDSIVNLDHHYGDLLASLNQFDLPPEILERKHLWSLSGGERIKCQLIMLTLLKPDVYLLDEPSNDIDLKTIQWLQQFIIQLEAPVLFVSHDELLIQACATKLLHLEASHRKTQAFHSISSLKYFDYVKQRQHQINKDTQIAFKQKRTRKIQEQKLQQQFEKVQHSLRTISRQDPSGARLLKKKMKSIKSKEKRYEKEAAFQMIQPDPQEAINLKFNVKALPSSKEIINIENGQLKIESKLLLKNYNLIIKASEHVGFRGDNGSGKTTLLKHISTLLKEKTELKVGIMPQDYEEQFNENHTPYTFLAITYEKEEQDLIYNTLGALQFTYEEMNQNVHNLSGGQKAKLFLARFILNDCNVLLLDEPTRNLSPLSNPELRQMLSEYQGCIIAVSHDRLFLKEVCHTIYNLENQSLQPIDSIPIS